MRPDRRARAVGACAALQCRHPAFRLRRSAKSPAADQPPDRSKRWRKAHRAGSTPRAELPERARAILPWLPAPARSEPNPGNLPPTRSLIAGCDGLAYRRLSASIRLGYAAVGLFFPSRQFIANRRAAPQTRFFAKPSPEKIRLAGPVSQVSRKQFRCPPSKVVPDVTQPPCVAAGVSSRSLPIGEQPSVSSHSSLASCRAAWTALLPISLLARLGLRLAYGRTTTG